MHTDWQVGPRNRWAYVHVDEIVPTVLVPRGGSARELGPAHPGEPAELPEYADGLAIVRDGRLVAEAYGGEMDEASLHLSQSVGKSVLGLLVKTLRLDTATPVTELVPEVEGSGYAGATLQHLLDMTAAIDFVEDYAVDFWRYDVACAWHPPREGADAETVLDFLPTIGPAAWGHGERVHYATPNTDLLGIATERAAGAPLAELIARALWAPAGAERDARLTVDRAGTATIGGGFCATLRDYARLGLLAREADLGRGDPAAFARLTTPDIRGGADAYGDQWWRRDGAQLARGIHGQLIAVDAATVVVALSSWPDAVDPEREAEQRALVRRALAR